MAQVGFKPTSMRNVMKFFNCMLLYLPEYITNITFCFEVEKSVFIIMAQSLCSAEAERCDMKSQTHALSEEFELLNHFILFWLANV